MATKGSRGAGTRTKLKEASIDAAAMMRGALGQEGIRTEVLGIGFGLILTKTRWLEPSP